MASVPRMVPSLNLNEACAETLEQKQLARLKACTLPDTLSLYTRTPRQKSTDPETEAAA